MDRRIEIEFGPEGSDALDVMMERDGLNASTTVNRAVQIMEILDDHIRTGGAILLAPAGFGAHTVGQVELKTFAWERY